MKKLINIFLCMSILCGCAGMPGLQRQSTTNLHKTTIEEDGLYYNDKEGHNKDVKMSIISKEYYRIEIPVDYSVNAKNLDKISTIPSLSKKVWTKGLTLNTQQLLSTMIPEVLKNQSLLSLSNEGIEYFNHDIAECNNCSINKDYLTIDIIHDKGTWRAPGTISISESKNILEIKATGVIDSTFAVTPKQMRVSCNNKSCAVIDENYKFVNKIVINRNITTNEKKIKELITAEKLAEQKRKIEEEKRKKEEAKRKAEEARREAEYRKEQQKQQKLRARQCPDLYRILAMAQQGYYVDPIISVRAARRFEELDCGTWLNEQLNGY